MGQGRVTLSFLHVVIARGSMICSCTPLKDPLENVRLIKVKYSD